MTTSIFITGTNTGVGKTITSALILAAAHCAQRKVNYFKPIQTGDESDCALIKSLTDVPDVNIKYPVYSFKLPASPFQAALEEQRSINPLKILTLWRTISLCPTIVEGVGGLLVPISKSFLLRDLIKLLNLNLIIVANTHMGTINHILLTIEAAVSEQIPILGIILIGNNNYPWLQETITAMTNVPILTQIPWQSSLRPTHLMEKAKELFNQQLLDQFFGKKIEECLC